jgi:YegS/Rv2252/BmrU family lipid kinase
MNFKVIANPVAGRGRVDRILPHLRQIFEANNLKYELALTEAPHHATALAREAAQAGWENIIAVGGDGTMNEVLNGVMETPASMGFIPAGTGNDLARSLNIPFDLKQAVSVFAHGNTTSMDIGKDSDGYFSIILGLGFPSDVMHHVNTTKNIFRGSLAITASIIQVVNKLRPYPVHIQLDDRAMDTTVMGIFILNTRFTGGGLQLAPHAKYDDGLLDVVIMHEMSKMNFLTTLPKAYKGKHLTNPACELFQTKTIKITTAEPMRKLFDGNVYGESPVDAHIIPNALKIWVPGGGD